MLRNKHRFWMGGLLGVLLLGTVSSAEEPGSQQHAVTLQQIVDAWRARQRRFRDVRVEWTETRTDFARMHAQLGQPTAPRWPDEDTTFETDCALTLSQRRSRLDVDGMIWVGPGTPPTLGPRRDTIIFNGTDATRFHGEAGEGRYPYASISHRISNNELRTAPLKPLSWCFRPLDPDMGGEREDRLTLLNETGLVGGRVCPVVGVESDSDRLHYDWKLWIDPQQDFNVARAFLPAAAGGAEMQFEISYSGDSPATAHVSGWEYDGFRGENPQCRILGNVTRVDSAPSVDASTFQVEFPPGTWVTDSRGEREENWIVKEDQSPRPIVGSEILSGATYEDLVATESGAARGNRPAPRQGWLERNLWLIALGLLSVVGVWWWATRRPSQMRSTG